MKEENKITLRPKDYLVTAGGVKIENITEDMVFEIDMPERILMYPLEISSAPTPTDKPL